MCIRDSSVASRARRPGTFRPRISKWAGGWGAHRVKLAGCLCRHGFASHSVSDPSCRIGREGWQPAEHGVSRRAESWPSCAEHCRQFPRRCPSHPQSQHCCLLDISNLRIRHPIGRFQTFLNSCEYEHADAMRRDYSHNENEQLNYSSTSYR